MVLLYIIAFDGAKPIRHPLSAMKQMTRIAVLFLLVGVLSACTTSSLEQESLCFVGNVWTSGVTVDNDFLTYWNAVTPENAGKWGNVETARGEMNWDDLDVAYRFAVGNDIPFRFHTLVWGRSQPPWLGRLSDEDLLAEVSEWIALAGERYPEVDMIDVVNEPLHSLPPYAYALGGPGDTGWDWVITAFELARTSFPRAQLGLNEYGILASRSATDAYLRLVLILKNRGLIDTIGVQGHKLESVDRLTIAGNLDRLATAGLPIYVTELDLALEDDVDQLQKMRELMNLFAEDRRVHGVTFWGYKAGQIYSGRAALLRADGTERPALTWLREFIDSAR